MRMGSVYRTTPHNVHNAIFYFRISKYTGHWGNRAPDRGTPPA